MTISTDFAEFIETITIYTASYDRTAAKATKTETESDIEAIIQPYSETSLNSNPTMRDKKLDGKDLKGSILIMTDEDLPINDSDVFLDYDSKRYKIEQRMPYSKIFTHYEYLACIVKAQ